MAKSGFNHHKSIDNSKYTELNGWQLAKMKKSIPDMSLPWNV